ncbi:uncharacterized protein [Temnothorax nylanderi]|uniref:uncharacterized protein isoform X1 n=1 Tax=Temnothorax nylanderi TaxID=102681 RepID=UPI003A8739F1
MYVYVKYLNDNTFKIVEDSSIKRFDCENIDYKKKYKVRWDNDDEYYDAIIIAIGESLSELEQLVKQTRVRIPNAKFCESADSVSDMEPSKAITKEADSDILFQKSLKERTLKMRKERGMENSIQSDSEKEHKPKRKKIEENDTEESVDKIFTNREPQICDVTKNKSTTDLLPKTKEICIQLDNEEEREQKKKKKKLRKYQIKNVQIQC